MLLQRLLHASFLASFLLAIPMFGATRIDLDGSGWTFRTTLEENSMPVTVPHCWLVQEGYEKYIGHAFYEHDFTAPALQTGQIVRLHFDGVYDVAQVWLNGKRLGTHEGGYTPFEFDVTGVLRPGRNHILVDVDNTPTFTSIPALATGSPSADKTSLGAESRASIVGWLPYGGIVRPVSLLVSDAVYLRNVKIDAKPNLQSNDAQIAVHVLLHNGGDLAKVVTVGRFYRRSQRAFSESENRARWRCGRRNGADSL